MKTALAQDELAQLIFSAQTPYAVKKLKSFLSQNGELWDTLSEPVKASVESVIYNTDKVLFSVYGDKAWRCF